MREYLIGTGGWSYFQVPGLHPLVAYSKAFSFVEVNSTFYRIPAMNEVEKWRKLVPPDFTFSVRANRVITHKYSLQATDESLAAFEKMKQICRILNAGILHLQTPPSPKSSQASIANLSDFLSSTNLGETRLALEMRGIASSKMPSALLRTMQDHNIIHCVDLSKDEMPAYKSDTLYSRLFGKGHHNVYQPTDKELQNVDGIATKGSFEKVAMSFHFVRMYKDAARLKTYKQTGNFPMITRSTGLSSFKEVLAEDAEFPVTKAELIESQGWKLFDLNGDRRTHATYFLEKLEERTYMDINEVMNTLNTAGK